MADRFRRIAALAGGEANWRFRQESHSESGRTNGCFLRFNSLPAGWRNQRRQLLDQFEWGGQHQPNAAARSRLDALIDQALCIDFTQPLQRKGRPVGEDDPGLAESAGMFLGSAARPALLSREELMKELNDDGAFTDR
jgi:hypothetical protein